MTVFQLLRFPETGICDSRELYYHIDEKSGEIFFNGYFNLFDIKTRKHFTTISSLRLRISVSGIYRIVLMHDRDEIGEEDLNLGQNIITFPYEEYDDGVFWFKLKNKARIHNEIEMPDIGIWEGDCIERRVKIAAITCTYKREEALLTNLDHIYSLCSGERFFEIFVIDNGNTLSGNDKMQRLLSHHISLHLIPNRNLGGTGGFTRGMIEAMNASDKTSRGFTHALMMDDDAVYDPEILIRLKGLISSLKPEYEGSSVGSALFRLDHPHIQQFSGEYMEGVTPKSYNSIMDMREYDNCIRQISFSNQEKLYSAWRFCCYPFDKIRDDNLPYPFFLHYDDTEYGIRDMEFPCIFLNGIAVWHRIVDFAEPGIVRYYEARNMMIFMSIRDDKYKPSDSIAHLLKRMIYLILEYRYEEAEMIYNGFNDYCRGPEWLERMDATDRNTKLVKWYNSQKKSKDMSEEELPKDMNISFKRIRDSYSDKVEKSKIEPLKLMALNGVMLPQVKEECIMTTLDSPFKAYRAGRVVIYDPVSKKGNIYIRNPKRTRKCLYLMAVMAKKAVDNIDMPGEYRKRYGYMTSASFWRKYLGIDDK